MPSNNNSLIYFRESIEGARTFFAPQSFLDEYPIVKVPGDENAPPIYYAEADQLTHLEALQLRLPQFVACIQEREGEAPLHLGRLDDFEGNEPPEETTHLLYSLPNVLDGMTMVEFVGQLQAANALYESQGKPTINPRHFFLRAPNGSGETEVARYLRTGKLPE